MTALTVAPLGGLYFNENMKNNYEKNTSEQKFCGYEKEHLAIKTFYRQKLSSLAL